MKEIKIHSLAECDALAERLAPLLPEVSCITLDGDLGAGKTTFTKALGKALGIHKTINSPTFTILKSYATAQGGYLHHMDAYRLENITQELGFEEVFDDGICVVEWPQFIESFLPKQRLCIQIRILDQETRLFVIQAMGEIYERIAEAL